jgi:hypothetical protein
LNHEEGSAVSSRAFGTQRGKRKEEEDTRNYRFRKVEMKLFIFLKRNFRGYKIKTLFSPSCPEARNVCIQGMLAFHASLCPEAPGLLCGSILMRN